MYHCPRLSKERSEAVKGSAGKQSPVTKETPVKTPARAGGTDVKTSGQSSPSLKSSPPVKQDNSLVGVILLT